MKKRVSIILAIVVMAMLLVGCCNHSYIEATCISPKVCTECGKTEGETIDHQWREATCAQPKTCIICNATEGTVLEHTWTAATCSSPKTCNICGAIEGESLAHSLKEANYQESAQCTVCQEFIGAPLKAEYEEKGIVSNDIIISEGEEIIGKNYEYFAMCSKDKSKITRGQILFLDSKKIESDEKHPAKDGYEWTILNFTLRYEDENFEYGIYPGFNFDDYYNIEKFEESARDIDDDYYLHFFYTVNWEGQDYEDCEVYMDTPYTFTDYACEIYLTVNICAPVGYDGSIIGFGNQQKEFIYDDSNAVYIRLK